MGRERKMTHGVNNLSARGPGTKSLPHIGVATNNSSLENGNNASNTVRSDTSNHSEINYELDGSEGSYTLLPVTKYLLGTKKRVVDGSSTWIGKKTTPRYFNTEHTSAFIDPVLRVPDDGLWAKKPLPGSETARAAKRDRAIEKLVSLGKDRYGSVAKMFTAVS